MALIKYRLGDLIKQSEEKNTELLYGISDVKGMSIQKKFIETKADMTGVSLSSYLLVKPDYFSYVTVTSRNGEKITLAHNISNDSYIVSSSYIVFFVEQTEILNSNYLFMYFNRPEFDRYARFNSWGSARETFTWDDFCDIEIELPPLEIQQRYVDIYNAMLQNQKVYELGLEDLKLVCDVYIENLRRNISCQKVGNYLIETRNKNEFGYDLKNKAVSNTKTFIDAKEAVFSGVDTKNYLIVEHNDFAYNTVTTRNADKLSIALNTENDCLVSPLYTTFKINVDNLLSEYLCLWFNRNEYDRYARYNSWGSARELYTFETLSDTEIPIPNTDIQLCIANIYNTYNKRKKLNEQLKKQLKDICPILIKGSIEEAKQGE